jgi:hypothetical protein
MSTDAWFREFERQEAMRQERLDEIRARVLPPTSTPSSPPSLDDEPFGEGECDCVYHAPSAADEDGWWEPVASCPLHGDTL